MEQVALLVQPLITSLLSDSKNYSLFKTLYTASANLVWPRRINSPCTNLFLLCGISCCFLYSYCLTELAQLIFFGPFWVPKNVPCCHRSSRFSLLHQQHFSGFENLLIEIYCSTKMVIFGVFQFNHIISDNHISAIFW